MAASVKRSQVYHFGIFEVDPRTHELRRHGVRIRLQEQPFRLLIVLLEHAGQVVTREELREQLWPSSVFVDFDHGLNNAIARLREALGDSATTPRYIETLPRVGYRFLWPVTTRIEPEGPAVESRDPTGSRIEDRPRRGAHRAARMALALGAAGAGLLVVVLMSSMLVDRSTPLSETPDSGHLPSIVVMPFASMSSDAQDGYFAEGLTEELVNRLASIRKLRVVARTSSFSFKDRPPSASQIAQTLKVSHILEGSVRRSGTRLRISAQLIDARRDEHVWSQTFDRDIDDLFRIQEGIAFAVAAALKVSLLEDEEFRIRLRGTENAEAYRLYVIAQAHLLGRTRSPDLAHAKRLLDRALELDPNFAAAHTGLARYYLRDVTRNLSEESARLGAAAAARSVELDPAMSEALQARANFEFLRARLLGDYQAHIAGESDMQRAIELDPGNSGAYEDFGRALIWHQPDFALSLLERATQLDMLCTFPNVLMSSVLGNLGRTDAARKRCTELLRRSPDSRICDMSIATIETYYGNFAAAVPLLEKSAKIVKGPARIELWSVYMSMDDPASASEWLDFGDLPFEKPLSEAARFAMAGRHDQAFAVLNRHRAEFSRFPLLDVPAAKFALLAREPQQALDILARRFPDLASGVQPVTARNVQPAIDLAAARWQVGAADEAHALLQQVAAYLDGPTVLRLPLFSFQRARVHALEGDGDAAFASLERAYREGLRTTWALDLRPQSWLYLDPIEADPAFDAVRDDPRFAGWFERLRAANAIQLSQIETATLAATPQ